jgi:hypothetical protein
MLQGGLDPTLSGLETENLEKINPKLSVQTHRGKIQLGDDRCFNFFLLRATAK